MKEVPSPSLPFIFQPSVESDTYNIFLPAGSTGGGLKFAALHGYRNSAPLGSDARALNTRLSASGIMLV